MKRNVKPHKPIEDKYIYTEGINYFNTSKKSIWGSGDKETLKILKKIDISGKWLNLAAGDGRYNNLLLQKADAVVASDIDKGALSKLWHNTPTKYKKKLKIKNFNLIKKFPFRKKEFNGLFCMGTLHLFPKKVLTKIISEIDKVLKNDGQIIFDFATDIKRTLPDGKLYIRKGEPKYKINEAIKYLEKALPEYKLEIHKSKVPEEVVETRGTSYKFKCNFLIVIAQK